MEEKNYSLAEPMMVVVRRTVLPLGKATLAWFEKGIISLWRNDSRDQYPPVFIIGPPRSGTTLLYQVLVDRYTFGYFSNWMAQFPGSPIVASWLHKIQSGAKGPPAEYTSDWGSTKGRTGPHEMGSFWYRWFPNGDEVYVPAGATPESSLVELRQEVSGMSRVFGASMIFKNVYNSMRLAPISEAFPEASFIVCLRDPIENARSILNLRIKMTGTKERWFSLPPREVAKIKRHPYWEQVVEQVYYTQQQISRDKQIFGAERFYDVRYEDFCEDVHGTLAGIHRFFEERKVKVQIRGEVPARFAVSDRLKDDADDYDRIVEKVRELWG
jgi:sulfotransferase family protein